MKVEGFYTAVGGGFVNRSKHLLNAAGCIVPKKRSQLVGGRFGNHAGYVEFDGEIGSNKRFLFIDVAYGRDQRNHGENK